MIGETILSTMLIIATLALMGILIYSIIYFYKEKEYWMSAFFCMHSYNFSNLLRRIFIGFTWNIK